MCESDKDEQDFKPDGIQGEEVDWGELTDVIAVERSPCLSWRFRISNHVFGNGSLRNLNVQLHEFTVNPRSPQRGFSLSGNLSEQPSLIWLTGRIADSSVFSRICNRGFRWTAKQLERRSRGVTQHVYPRWVRLAKSTVHGSSRLNHVRRHWPQTVST